MRLREYLENIKKLVEKHPEALELELVYSRDDEGNDYDTVDYEPDLGVYDEDEREWMSEAHFKEWQHEYREDDEDDEVEKFVPNSICIN
jgi:hypothetical protein